MTNHWIDIKNSDVILIMGANPAENHPISFKWVMEARQNGATVISVDPRFTRSSAKADIYAPIRSGTDIAFLGGLIKYILDNDLYHKEYVIEHTNASYLVNPEYTFEAGIFGGYQPEARSYEKGTWWYQMDENWIQKQDPTLQHPNCVMQLLCKHYERYDLDTVSGITGTPKADLLEVYSAVASTGKPGRVATVMYAMGWTQHTYGTQNIRAAAIIQLLLGNIGLPERFVIRWDGQKWEGDVPDGGWPPGEKLAFIMRRGGRARIFGPTMADGPFPEHYEPWESPAINPLHIQGVNPALWDLEIDVKGATHAYPIVGTTYRLSEHWQTGAMTRNQPWLAELQPGMFVEMSPELAAEKGIRNGEQVIVASARGAIEAVALVTRRLRPFIINGQLVHEVGLGLILPLISLLCPLCVGAGRLFSGVRCWLSWGWSSTGSTSA